VGIGKGCCIGKGKRPFMRRLKGSGLLTRANGDPFIERSVISKGKS